MTKELAALPDHASSDGALAHVKNRTGRQAQPNTDIPQLPIPQ